MGVREDIRRRESLVLEIRERLLAPESKDDAKRLEQSLKQALEAGARGNSKAPASGNSRG
jgi:pantothenate synthetase